MKWTLPSGSSTILLRLSVSLCLMLTACASGTTKTQVPGVPNESVESVRQTCTDTFPLADSGAFERLWFNKRTILKQSRDCTNAARILLDEVEARNKAIKELEK